MKSALPNEVFTSLPQMTSHKPFLAEISKHQYLPHYSIFFGKKLQTLSVEPTEHFGIYFGYIRRLFQSWVSPFNVHSQCLQLLTLLDKIFKPVKRQSMKWIEMKRSSPVQIHKSLILIQFNPADDPEAESSPVQSGLNRIGIYLIPCKIYIKNKRRCV